MTMARPCGTCLISRSRIPSSGGLMRSSAELIARSGARIFSKPGPGMHPDHRGAHHEPRMIHAESFREQTILCVNHVPIAVTRKLRVHPVTWFARFSVSDTVGQHNKKLRRIERLARSEKFTRKF